MRASVTGKCPHYLRIFTEGLRFVSIVRTDTCLLAFGVGRIFSPIAAIFAAPIALICFATHCVTTTYRERLFRFRFPLFYGERNSFSPQLACTQRAVGKSCRVQVRRGARLGSVCMAVAIPNSRHESDELARAEGIPPVRQDHGLLN